ncbi:MAG: putative RND superfamily exporter protein [Hyphomicrobiaceae bacterium]|jgi:predicted RND superfamily exporter protein
MLEWFSSLLVKRPWGFILATALATGALVGPMQTIPVNTDVEAFMPVGDDAIENLRLLENVFGSPLLTMIIVLREDHPDGVYNPETMAVIDEITEWLRSQEEYETATNADLRSLASVNDIRGHDDDMIVESFLEELPTDREAALDVRKRVFQNGIYVGSLSSYNGKGAAILVRNSELGIERHLGTYQKLSDRLAQINAAGHPEVFHLTGRPIVEALFGSYIPAEGRRMLPFVVALIALFLAAAFRTVRGVLLPMLVVLTTEIWMLGIHGLWGEPFYTVSSILPILVIAVSVADAIHLMARYYEAQREHPELDREGIVKITIEDMARPVLLTSLTTAIGFISMTGSAVVPVHDFGITMTFGIIAAWILSLCFLPAVLAVLPLRPMGASAAASDGPREHRLEGFLQKSAEFAVRRPKAIAGAFAILALFCAGGVRLLTIDSSQVNQFRPSHEIRFADGVSNRMFAGGTVLDILVDSREPGAIQNPKMLEAIATLQSKLEEDEQVGDSLSIAEMIERMNRIMHGDDPAYETIPTSRELVAQYLLLYSISGDPGDFDDLVDYDYRYAHLIVFLRDPGTALSRRTVARAQELAAALFADDGPAPADVLLTGPAYTVARMEAHISHDQLTTLMVCIPILITLNWIMFRSLVSGFLSVVPVIFAVLAAYGSMGYVGLPADVASAMLGGMTLGIGVDFAIHYLHRYRTLRRAGLAHTDAATVTARTTGLALFVNMVVLAGGFLVMLGSRFYPQMKLGAMVALTMIVCYVATMYLFPAILTLQDSRET